MKKIKWFVVFLLAVCMFLPVHADNTEYVKDTAGKLTSAQVQELNAKAAEISQKYNVGVYIRIEADDGGYSSVGKYSEALYSQEQLGYGTGSSRECVLLLITMADRHYDIMAHGDTCNAAFTDYGKELLVDNILPYLKSNDYNGAFTTFVSKCGTYLSEEAAGTPIDVAGADPQAHAKLMSNIRYGVTFIGAPLIGLIVCLIIKARNKTAGIKYEAAAYVPKGGVQLTGMQDIFLYRTETVTHISRDSHGGGGGTSINSGGFSHSSGSF